jgi:hypothetical protein
MSTASDDIAEPITFSNLDSSADTSNAHGSNTEQIQQDDILILAERRREFHGASALAGPNGTPILAGFSAGMTKEEIRSQFPMLTESPEHGFCGRCKVFGFDAILSLFFTPYGELEALLAEANFETRGDADNAFIKIVREWESELRAIDHVWHEDGFTLICSGSLSLGFGICLDPAAPHVRLTASAIVPGSHTEGAPRDVESGNA